MCGQLGVAGTIPFKSEDVFKRLLVYNAVRGLDSTGAAAVKRYEENGKPRVVVAKELGNPFNLMHISRKRPETDFTEVMSGTHKVLLGHCRAGTRGGMHRRNAHPFSFTNVVGTHNGTLNYQTEKELGDYKFDTDSEKLFAYLDDNGPEKTFKVLRKTDAYALVWYDARNNTLNFIRNKERPLYYAYDKKKEQLFWSSEYGHLYAALLTDIDHDDKFMMIVEPDNHYVWEVPEPGKPFGKPHVSKREGKEQDPFRLTNHNHTQTGGTGPNGTHWIPENEKKSLLATACTYNPDTRMYEADDGITYYTPEDWAEYVHEDKLHDGIPFWSTEDFIWTKYNSSSGMHIYSFDKIQWYTSQQSAWNLLSTEAKIKRVMDQKVPRGVVVAAQIQQEVYLIRTGDLVYDLMES